jgi:hypothetical protein
MATTVISAFNEFMRDYVDLDSDEVSRARNSRNWLIEQLNKLADEKDNGFPSFYKEKHMGFGSFSRSTKKRNLDDIDHMICMNANNCWYSEDGNTVYIHVPESAREPFTSLKHDNSDKLNSTKVINLFVSNLKRVPQYSNSEKHARSGEAATLKLTSYTWNFDIIPCFFTTEDSNKKTYYIIPDGYGNWKKTDPRIDKEKTTKINQDNNGKVLKVIRIMKYWNKRQTMRSMKSYLLENIILDYYKTHKASSYVDFEVVNILSYMTYAIYMDINDPKGLQGNINTLSEDDKKSILNRAKKDSDAAIVAKNIEFIDPQKAIEKWKEIFGNNFPSYTGS